MLNKLALAALLCLGHNAFGQEKPEIPYTKWEIGLNSFMPLNLSQTREFSGGLWVRMKPNSDSPISYRLRAWPYLFDDWGKDSPYNKYFPPTFSINGAIGIQKEKAIGQFAFRTGVDLLFSHSYSKSKADLGTNSPNGVFAIEERFIQYGLSVFIGGEWLIHKHFSLSAESHLAGYFGFFERNTYVYPNFVEEQLTHSSRPAITLSAYPIYNLNLNYKF
jgi:hypothetical protein